MQALYARSRVVRNLTYGLFGLEIVAMTASLVLVLVLALRGLEFDEECIVLKSNEAILGYGYVASGFSPLFLVVLAECAVCGVLCALCALVARCACCA